MRITGSLKFGLLVAVLLGIIFPVYVWLTALTSRHWQARQQLITEHIDTADRAAPLVRDRNGDTHYVAALRAPQKHGLAVSDTAYAHVVHRDAP